MHFLIWVGGNCWFVAPDCKSGDLKGSSGVQFPPYSLYGWKVTIGLLHQTVNLATFQGLWGFNSLSTHYGQVATVGRLFRAVTPKVLIGSSKVRFLSCSLYGWVLTVGMLDQSVKLAALISKSRIRLPPHS